MSSTNKHKLKKEQEIRAAAVRAVRSKIAHSHPVEDNFYDPKTDRIFDLAEIANLIESGRHE